MSVLRAIGFRVTTSELFYSVVQGDTQDPELIINSKLKPPAAFTFPQVLAWYREQVIGLFHEYSIDACGIKMAEPISRTMGAAARDGAIKRNNIEGVLVETVTTSDKKVVYGNFSTISSLLDTKKPKGYLTKEDFRGIEKWSGLNQNYKESVLAAVSALGELAE